MINRIIVNRIIQLLDYFPVIGIIGPRQIGKTTLVKSLIPQLQKESLYLDLELDSDFQKLKDAELFLKQFEGKTIIIDEVQRNKHLFPLIRALVDQKREPARFILLGSASPDLIRDSSESLAGRIVYFELQSILLNELPDNIDYKKLWISGGFPECLLINNPLIRNHWYASYIKTYVERDIPLMGLNVNPIQVERLWRLIASLNGQLANYSEIAKSLGLSSNTIKTYIDFFEGAFLIRRLYPFHANISKRIVKTPKIYIRDTGILHYMFRIADMNELFGHFSVGSSWEGFVIQQIIGNLGEDCEYYFYRTHNGSEIDLVVVKGGKNIATVEVKLTSAPILSKGNIYAINDVKAESNYIVVPESDDFYLKENVLVCSLKSFVEKHIINLGRTPKD